jgi:hypothetical protein
MASDIRSGRGRDQIIPALDRLVGSLETRRAILAGRTRDRRTVLRGAAVSAGAAYTSSNRTAGTAEVPAPPAQPSDLALLWTTTQKLYDSWPFKLLGLLLISAILLAGGGTLLIGGQALQLRKNLEDAGDKEAKGIAQIAKNTRDAVSDQSQTVLGNLTRQQTDINMKISKADAQISDLTGRADQIKTEAVDRVVIEIRKDFGALERKLQDDLEKSLNKIRDDGIGDLQGKITLLRPKVQELAQAASDGQTSINTSAAGIKTLVDTAAGAQTLKQQTAFVLDARNSAEEALRKVNAHEQTAAAAERRVGQLLKDVEDRLNLQFDQIMENQRKLGGSDVGLSLLSEALQKAGLDSAGIQKILDGVSQTRDSVSAIDRRLVKLKTLANDLDQRVKQIAIAQPVTKPAPETPPRTEASLSGDQWKAIQRSLKSLRFYTGKVDGNPGTGTHTAIEKYQDEKHLPRTQLTPEQISDLIGSR